MKILFVLEQLNIGGPQKSLLGMLEHIDFEKNTVDVLLLQNAGQLGKYLGDRVTVKQAADIVTAFTFPAKQIRKTLKIFWHKGGIRLFLAAVYMLVKHAVRADSMNVQRQKFWIKYRQYLPVLETEYDIAFGYAPVMSTYFVADCVRAKHKCHWVRGDYRMLDMDLRIEAQYFKKMDGIIAVSNMCRDIFTGCFPFAKKKSSFFYNYIPYEFYKSLPEASFGAGRRQGGIRILTAARIDFQKGVNLILEACELLREKISFTWYIAGDGPARRFYEKKCKKAGLEKELIFMGFQLNMLSCLKQSDLFVLPSATEGKSNAVDEARDYGMPVIVTNYPTAGEQITDGETGLICDMTGADLAAKILRVAADRNLAERLTDNCRKMKQIHETPQQLFERIVCGCYEYRPQYQ